MKYQVKTFRDAGLEAGWTKTRRGTPFIRVRDPAAENQHQRTRWWLVDATMWESMKVEGVVEGFYSHTALADIFSIAV